MKLRALQLFHLILLESISVKFKSNYSPSFYVVECGSRVQFLNSRGLVTLQICFYQILQ
ncbi:hypothetical protein KC19_12G178100 [Ceratodon purpureus]|uniref:Uncharacterized protein n=1 Tax=Ceratodon purpureus TaxID=3225 RepID=A0A8T0GEC5_CERPU|nr:hypothetical protein KC19_12G178100 [Ceratodon purpureus]